MKLEMQDVAGNIIREGDLVIRATDNKELEICKVIGVIAIRLGNDDKIGHFALLDGSVERYDSSKIYKVWK